MSETNLAEFDAKTGNDRLVLNVLYGLHTVSWLSGGTLAVVALIANYVKRSGEHDVLYLSHHNYMIRTFWWTAMWLAVSCPLFFLFFFPGMIAWAVIGLWYLFRCIKGWLRFSDNRFPD
jgi:uncharacterized membrane protein